MALRVLSTVTDEPVQVYVLTPAGAPRTGLAPGAIVVKIRRDSDGFWFDFSDATFKVKGAVVALTTPCTEVDAADDPGIYAAADFDFTLITNPLPDDNYQFIAAQTAGPASRLPGPLEVKIDQWPRSIEDTVEDTNELERAEVVVIPQGSPLGAPPREERKNAAGVVIAQGNAFEDASGTVPYRGNGLADRKRLS